MAFNIEKKQSSEKGVQNDGRINLLHGMEKRIKPKTQRGRLNERVKRIEFSLFFFFLIFLQANSLKWFSLKNLARARQSILLVRLDKTYDRIRNTWNHLSKRNKRG